ncbi:MAG: XdhC family protein [Pseudomonadota bacterium]
MQQINIEVLTKARDWIVQQRQVWLATIAAASGSSPRPVGSLLCADGVSGQVGSLSGGCVEEDLLDQLRSGALSVDVPTVVEYGVSAEENERLGLPCGGRLTVLVQPLGDADVRWIDALLDSVLGRSCVQRALDMSSGVTSLVEQNQFTELEFDGSFLRQSFGPQMRMILVGAGHLSETLAELALSMDYEVLVTDPRQAILDQWSGPEVPLHQGMPDDVVTRFGDDERCIIITLTHDPRIDDMALMEALTSRAWYVGALGSMRTTEKRLERLRQLDIPFASLQRLRAPVGLDIGSKTPLEIAVAIMAELTQLRANKAHGRY